MVRAMLAEARQWRRCGVIALTAVLAGGGLGLGEGPEAVAGIVVVHRSDTSNLRGTLPEEGPQGNFTVCDVVAPSHAVGDTWHDDLAVNLNADGYPVVTFQGNRLRLACGNEHPPGPGPGADSVSFELEAGSYVLFESSPRSESGFVAQPVIVTVPTRIPSQVEPGDPPLHVQHVYPKNTVAGTGAATSSEIFGDTLSRTITVPIAKLPSGGQGERFTLQTSVLECLADVRVELEIQGETGNVAPLAPEDYRAAAVPAMHPDEISVELTLGGLEQLSEAVGGRLTVKYDGRLCGSGEMRGTAAVVVNGIPVEDASRSGVEEVERFWNYVHVLNLVTNIGSEDEVPLSGTVFDAYLIDKLRPSCPASPPQTFLWRKRGIVTDSNGKTFNGTLGEAYYCFYPISVPAGYKGGPEQPLLVLVDSEGAHEVAHYRQIGAQPGDLPDLPLTGSTGRAGVVLAGILCLSVGVVLLGIRGGSRTDPLRGGRGSR